VPGPHTRGEEIENPRVARNSSLIRATRRASRRANVELMAVIAAVAAIAGVVVAVAVFLFRSPAQRREAQAASWNLAPSHGQLYRLTNRGPGVALDVAVDLGDYPAGLTRYIEPWQRIDAGAHVEFLVIKTDQVAPPTVAVSWRSANGKKRHTWSTQLP
jgi:hypothetical protein